MNFFKNIFKKIKYLFKRDRKSHLSISGVSVNFDWYGTLALATLISLFAILNSISLFKEVRGFISDNVLSEDNERKKTLNVEEIKNIIDNRGGSSTESVEKVEDSIEEIQVDENTEDSSNSESSAIEEGV